MRRFILVIGLLLVASCVSLFPRLSAQTAQLASDQEDPIILLLNTREGIRECYVALKEGRSECPISHEPYAEQPNGPMGCNYHIVLDSENSIWAVLTAYGWIFLSPLYLDEVKGVESYLAELAGIFIPVIPTEVWRNNQEITFSPSGPPPPPGSERCNIDVVRPQSPLSGICDPTGCVWGEVRRQWVIHCERCSSRMQACPRPLPFGWCNHRRRHEVLQVTYRCWEPALGIDCTTVRVARIINQRHVATRRDCAGNPCRGRIWRPLPGQT